MGPSSIANLVVDLSVRYGVQVADSGARVTLRPWCKAEDYWHVQYEVYRAILERFRERQIAVAYPVREIRMVGTKAS